MQQCLHHGLLSPRCPCRILHHRKEEERARKAEEKARKEAEKEEERRKREEEKARKEEEKARKKEEKAKKVEAKELGKHGFRSQKQLAATQNRLKVGGSAGVSMCLQAPHHVSLVGLTAFG